ncbi:MAG: helix-turn-helix domain-containing protein [Candidatus Thiodiazotropha sp.]
MTSPPGSSAQLDAVPLYPLYGEESGGDDTTLFIHIESIAARSRLYAWEIDSHTHRGLLQTLVIFNGGGEVHLDDVVMPLAPPQAIVIPPTTIHAFNFEPDTHGYVLTISESMILDTSSRRGRALFDALFLQPRTIDLSPDRAASKAIEDLLIHLLAEFQSLRRGHGSLIEWLAKSVLLLIERQLASLQLDMRTSGGRAQLFTRFRALVEQHYMAHWSVADYAKALNVTPSKLNRVSKALAGRSAFELSQERLLLEARRRLVYISAPVQLLAYELGFEDAAYFNRFFKKRTGMTPARFRREQHRKLG